MSYVINKTTRKVLRSVNTPDYDPADWIINPVLPAVAQKYWKIVGDTVQEMTQGEKDAVDAAEAAEAAQVETDRKDITKALDPRVVALAKVMVDEINILRAQHSLADRTINQLANAIANKM